MIETIAQRPLGEIIGIAPLFEVHWSNPEYAMSVSGAVWATGYSNTSPTHQISSAIKSFLSNHPSIESAWIEDLGKEVNVLIMTRDVRNATLDPIFDAKVAMLKQYPYVKFNFELNPVDFQKKLLHHQIKRIV